MPRDAEARFWNPEVETLSRDALRALQWRRLGPQLRYDYERSPFYRARFEAAGIEPDDIRSLEDLRALPLMTKDEHRAAQSESLARHGNPYALLACARADEIVRINATSGTTGVPTLYTLTAHDVAVVNEMHARKYWRAGIRPGHVMLQALSLSMFTGGLPLADGIQHLGACVVPVGVEGGVERVLEFIELTRPAAIVATPSFGAHLAEECAKRSGREPRDLGLEWFFCAGEPGGGEAPVRAALGAAFGARVFDHTGGGHAFHGISCDAPPGTYRGMHFVSEDHCVLELVDPASKAPVALAEGAVGEMVWSFLDWRGGPLLRYAVGDVARVWTSPCPCGMPGLRFAILGRADDMLIVKGVNLYPQAVQNALLAFRPQVTGAFRIVLDAPGPRVTPPLRIRLEHGEGVGEGELEGLEARLRDHFRAALSVTPAFEWLPPGALPRASHKTKLIEVAGRAQ